MRYKIRREAEGAIVFDRVERRVFALTETQVTSLLEHQSPAATDGFEFFCSGRADFIVVEPLKEVPPHPNFVSLAAPNRLYLELTRLCNLRCRMCYNQAGRKLPAELSLDQLRHLLDEMDRVGVFEARLTGGEPTQRSDILDILDYAIDKEFYVSLATNAIWDDDLTTAICRRPIDDVIVSLDGPEEINDWFRSGGSFRRSIRTIRALKESGIRKVRINTVLSRFNWQRVEPLFQLCREYDLLLIDFIHPRPFGRGATPAAQSMMLTDEQTFEFNRLIAALRDKYPGVKVVMDFDLLAKTNPERHPIVPRVRACPAGREFAFVSPQGYVFPCGVAPVHDIGLMDERDRTLFVAGNVLKRGLLEIWHYSPVWVPFRDLKQCKPPKCFECVFWGRKCFGTCPIGAYYDTGRLNGEDPYCYSDRIPIESVVASRESVHHG
jgi:radical SAM protein with 4Fe4S-binding SPASM domain